MLNKSIFNKWIPIFCSKVKHTIQDNNDKILYSGQGMNDSYYDYLITRNLMGVVLIPCNRVIRNFPSIQVFMDRWNFPSSHLTTTPKWWRLSKGWINVSEVIIYISSLSPIPATPVLKWVSLKFPRFPSTCSPLERKNVIPSEACENTWNDLKWRYT